MRLDLTRGRFLRRYKRFFADVELPTGEVVCSHCPNTGSMATLLDPGAPAWVRHDPRPHRRLAWTLTVLGLGRRGRALVDTSLPNAVVEEGILRDRIPEVAGYDVIRREVPYGAQRSRIDLLLEDTRGELPSCFIEVKNCTMASATTAGRADFPDSPSVRGVKHLEELTSVARGGSRAIQFYLVGRTDCVACGLAREIDPDYAAAAAEARERGVEFLAYRAVVRANAVTVGAACPFEW